MEMFDKILTESSEFATKGGEPKASVGEFVRTEVHWLKLGNWPWLLALISQNSRPAYFLMQVQKQAAEEWKDVDAKTRSLRLCVISHLLKQQCCINGTHSLDEVGLGAFGLYKTLPGLDCTFPRYILYFCQIVYQYCMEAYFHWVNRKGDVAWWKKEHLVEILILGVIWISTLFFFSCRGYEGVIENLLSELPRGLVTHNRPVSCVHWHTEKTEKPLMVECSDGEKIAADHVIVTLPLGRIRWMLVLVHPY